MSIVGTSNRGPSRHELTLWIAENMPELDAELFPLSMEEVRKRLNALTWLDVLSSDLIEHGSKRFLEALKRLTET